jgi:hypothetical protein
MRSTSVNPVTRRDRAIASAVGSARAEGVVPAPLTRRLLAQYAYGRVTADEAVAELKRYYAQSQPSNAADAD